MSDEHASEPVMAEVLQPILQVNWEAIQAKRQSLAAALEQMSGSFPSEGKKRLNSLRSWFSQPRSFEEALVRSDVLAVCLPLCRSLELDGDLGESDIAAAIRVGFCSLGQNSAGSRQLLKALAYPAVVLLSAVLVAIFFSIYVIPEFQNMFDEFGIELSGTTLFVFKFAKLVRIWSGVLVIWLASAMGIVWYMNRVSSQRRPDGLGWLDLWMQSSRTALADWAWHLSLLLEAGLSQTAAMRPACRFAGKSWLRERSSFWARAAGPVQAMTESSLSDEGTLQSDLRPRQFLTNPKYQLLDHALSIPNSAGKIQLLREVARYYRDRNRNVGLWWIEWLVTLLLWGIGGVVMILVISLFVPLVSIITGLTGV